MADSNEVSLTDAEGGGSPSPRSNSKSNATTTTTTTTNNNNSSSNNNNNYFSSERSAAASENQSYGDMITEWFNTPGKVGTYMSYFLILVGMIGSIIAQKCADKDIQADYWLDDCPAGYDEQCKGNGAVYRFSFALFIIFALQVIGTTIDLRFYDALWVPKLALFGGLVVWFYYTPGHVFDDHGYAWLARILAFFYVILQQIILIDFAYNWNDSWVNKAEEHGGNKWIIILLVTCFILIGGSYSAIGVMFWQFGPCDSAEVILSLTVVLPTLALIYQVFFVEEKASLMTSAIMMAYATYICYSALTLNPEKSCNPTIATKYQTLSTVIGMVILVLSMTYSTSNTLKSMPAALDAQGHHLSTINVNTRRSLLQQGGVVFALVSCYFCMILTNWATLQASFNLAIPKNGEVAMWLQAAGQWIAILLYIWSMIAPKILTDRDFS